MALSTDRSSPCRDLSETVRVQIENLQQDYNDTQPLSSLGNLTLREFTQELTTNAQLSTTRLSA